MSIQLRDCLSAEVKDADRGVVHAIVARTEDVDKDGDVFLPGAFGEQAVRVSAYSHKSWPNRGGERPVGRGTIRELGAEVHAELRYFLSTEAGREEFNTVREMGDLQQWSYGFPMGSAKLAKVPAYLKDRGGKRAFVAVEVIEVSPVMVGASNGTRTLGTKTAIAEAEFQLAVIREARRALDTLDEGEAVLDRLEAREAVARLPARALKAAFGNPGRVHVRTGRPPFPGIPNMGVVVTTPEGRVWRRSFHAPTEWMEIR